MNFIEETEKLLCEIKKDIRAIEKYIQSIEDENVCIDNITVEGILENIQDNVNTLFIVIS